ncbi:hypothetical protein F5144DRAFT_356844 [Chaetomium tenue]|uniref:Uncharacterized protein n=1 Tax=Chaetomium tenue TaxID=1854479 RepID=A0ACB7NYC8_9PEZI|nr:hypothetical protein F5144DRAFT_356844 [Chaetomium globosum]
MVGWRGGEEAGCWLLGRWCFWCSSLCLLGLWLVDVDEVGLVSGHFRGRGRWVLLWAGTLTRRSFDDSPVNPPPRACLKSLRRDHWTPLMLGGLDLTRPHPRRQPILTTFPSHGWPRRPSRHSLIIGCGSRVPHQRNLGFPELWIAGAAQPDRRQLTNSGLGN